jgi:hypothetical protein
MKAFISEVEKFLKDHKGLEEANELTLYIDSINRPEEQEKVKLLNSEYIINIVQTLGSFTRVVITKCIDDESDI